jgi:hypothetical protein
MQSTMCGLVLFTESPWLCTKHSPIYDKFKLHQIMIHLTKIRTFMQLLTLNNKHTSRSNEDLHSANLECKYNHHYLKYVNNPNYFRRPTQNYNSRSKEQLLLLISSSII